MGEERWLALVGLLPPLSVRKPSAARGGKPRDKSVAGRSPWRYMGEESSNSCALQQLPSSSVWPSAGRGVLGHMGEGPVALGDTAALRHMVGATSRAQPPYISLYLPYISPISSYTSLYLPISRAQARSLC